MDIYAPINKINKEFSGMSTWAKVLTLVGGGTVAGAITYGIVRFIKGGRHR